MPQSQGYVAYSYSNPGKVYYFDRFLLGKYFDSWTPTDHSTTELSYRKIKRPIDSYEKNPHHDISLREEFIIEDDI